MATPKEIAARQTCEVLVDLLEHDWRDMGEKGQHYWPHEKKIIHQLIKDDLEYRVRDIQAEDADSFRQRINLSDGRTAPASANHKASNRPSSPLISTALVTPEMTQSPTTFPVSNEPKADIVILTVLPVERDAVLVAFGRDPNQKEDFSNNGNLFYRIPFRSTRYEKDMTAWLGMVGRPRNVPCAIFVTQLHRFFSFRTIALLGIAGGNKDKVELADVVATTEVLDNEGGVDYAQTFSLFGYQFSIGRHQPRIDKFNHDRSLRNLLTGFSPDQNAWHKNIQRIIVEGDRGALKFDRSDRDVKSELKLGLVQAGERLKRNGSLPQTSRTFHDKLYAVEMEGSGFAQACNSYVDDWIVFRGISDFGDTKKRDNRQACASVAAAVLMKQFMETRLQPTAVEDFTF